MRYNEFEGKTVVITGAASGIGKATALKFAQEKQISLSETLMNVHNKQHKKSMITVAMHYSLKQTFLIQTKCKH